MYLPRCIVSFPSCLSGRECGTRGGPGISAGIRPRAPPPENKRYKRKDSAAFLLADHLPPQTVSEALLGNAPFIARISSSSSLRASLFQTNENHPAAPRERRRVEESPPAGRRGIRLHAVAIRTAP